MGEYTDGNFEVVHDDDQEVIPALPSEDNIFAFTHNKRVELVKQLVPKGVMPADPKEQLILLSALKDMDHSAVARKRLRIEEGGNEVGRANASLIAKILGEVKHNANRGNPTVAVPGHTTPKLGDEFPSPELLDGETATTLPQQSYTTFMAQHAPLQDASSDDGSK